MIPGGWDGVCGSGGGCCVSAKNRKVLNQQFNSIAEFVRTSVYLQIVHFIFGIVIDIDHVFQYPTLRINLWKGHE